MGAQGMRLVEKAQQQQLPWLPASALEQHTDSLKEAAWWVRSGDKVYYAPPSSAIGLSANASEYFYAVGRRSDLTEEQAKSRVGGTGRVHIFHMPKGPASELEVSDLPPANRRMTLQPLSELERGAELAANPTYLLPSSYRDPLDSNGLKVESTVMASLTQDSYRSYIQDLTSSTTGRLRVTSRTWTDDRNTAAVVKYLSDEFKSFGLTTCIQTFKSWPHRGNPRVAIKDVFNVIGFVQGTDAGTVTMGAHFDDLPDRGTAPGAVDNGSGSSAVLASAKAFMAAGVRPIKSVYFVLFGGEEENLYGSDIFAAELDSPGSTRSPIPEACQVARTQDHTAITMDMIGWRNPRLPADTVTMETQRWASGFFPVLAQSNKVNNGNSLQLRTSLNPYGSDHMSFLERRFAGLLVIDNDGDSEAYPCYHKSCDSMSNINVRLATEISKMNLGALLRLSGVA